jgi:hypothetical protein
MAETIRISSTVGASSDLPEGGSGSFRTVIIDPFPKNISQVRVYAMARGHWLGDDPEIRDNGFVQRFIQDTNKFLGEFFQSTHYRRTVEERMARLRMNTMRHAILMAWINGNDIPIRNDVDSAFQNYHLGPLDEFLSEIPRAGSRFAFAATHWNQWASEDEFLVFVELTTA